jgi:hypothetical protein
MRKRSILCGLGLAAFFALPGRPEEAQFAAPERMKSVGGFIRVGDPGYAAPCWADLDGDGKKDLLVGQFHDGRITVYRNLGEGKLADGKLLEAEGKPVEVPGVW